MVRVFEEAGSNELGINADGLPVAKFGVGVVIQNPYAGRFSKDLFIDGAVWKVGPSFWTTFVEGC